MSDFGLYPQRDRAIYKGLLIKTTPVGFPTGVCCFLCNGCVFGCSLLGLFFFPFPPGDVQHMPVDPGELAVGS